MPENLSPHFGLTEFVKSATASRHGIDNTPGQIVVTKLKAWCVNIGEPIREHFTKKYPDKKIVVVINSGFRCPALNIVEGGVSSSQHLYGEAADIEIPGVPNDELWLYIVNELKVFDQVIAEHLKKDDGSAGWVHVSFHTGANRCDAISCIAKGKYVPGLQYA